MKLTATTVIRHWFDFSNKVCHSRRNLQLLGSSFNQKGRVYERIRRPCSGIGDGVFIWDFMMNLQFALVADYGQTQNPEDSKYL